VTIKTLDAKDPEIGPTDRVLSSPPGFEARVVNERSSELERVLETMQGAAANKIDGLKESFTI
jgi:hypothetical protein